MCYMDYVAEYGHAHPVELCLWYENQLFSHKMLQLFSPRIENSFALENNLSMFSFFLTLIVNLSRENNKAQNNIFSDIYL